MSSIKWMRGAICAILMSLSLVLPASAVDIETVHVGRPGNTGEITWIGGEESGLDYICGAVNYEYRIGTYEVTAGQYCEFLNAVAATDAYGLYDTHMTVATGWARFRGCQIQRGGDPGSYTYSVSDDWANRPVNFVSWGDAARFTNWLHNGQPTGPQGLATTEDGAYYLNGATTAPALMAVSRETDWTWAIPTEDEWYKAAYHKNDGDTGNYFDYPTGSDVAPSNNLTDPDPGNNATYYIIENDYTVGDPYYRTEVGAHENSESPYGAFDMGGNLDEWNEAVFVDLFRHMRGGNAADHYLRMNSAHADVLAPDGANGGTGFRVVHVPEPASMLFLALSGIGVLGRQPRRRS